MELVLGMVIQCDKERGDKLNFYIQASNPKVQCEINYSDETLADATESIFLLNTENAILMWNYICIPLSYKYDISYMLDDIMILLNELKNKKSGVITINWLPDTFRCNWTIRWHDKTLDIQAQWENTVGNLENLLNRCPNITLPKNDFIQEWKSVLGTVIKNLKDCGYNANNIKGMKQLIEIHRDIKGKGVLYKE